MAKIDLWLDFRSPDFTRNFHFNIFKFDKHTIIYFEPKQYLKYTYYLKTFKTVVAKQLGQLVDIEHFCSWKN